MDHMCPINTRFTKLLNVKSPIVSAPMAFASTPEMAVAVSGSGGFGFIGAGFDPSALLKEKLQAIRQGLDTPDNVPIPAGIGCIGWILDKTECSDDPRLPAILDAKPRAIWFAFGLDLGKYVAQVREYDMKRSHTTLIFVIVNTVEDAMRAVKEWKVDVVVAQGIEAGGHGSSEAPPLFSLLPAILRAIPDGPPVIAAGGITTGAQIAALLAMGADGVALGTRFLFTHECCYTDDMKAVMLEAGLNATRRGLFFDEVNRTMGWPPKHDGRAIANDVYDDYVKGLNLEERMKRFDDSKTKGERSRLVIWAGVGVGLVKEIRSASDVLCMLHDEAVRVLHNAPLLLEKM